MGNNKKFICSQYPDEGYVECDRVEQARKIMRCFVCADSDIECVGPKEVVE